MAETRDPFARVSTGRTGGIVILLDCDSQLVTNSRYSVRSQSTYITPLAEIPFGWMFQIVGSMARFDSWLIKEGRKSLRGTIYSLLEHFLYAETRVTLFKSVVIRSIINSCTDNERTSFS